MSKPKVLVFIDWYLPGTRSGGPVRSCANLMDHLSGDIEFSIITTDTDYTEDAPYPNVISDQWTLIEGGTRVWYCSKGNVKKDTFKTLIAEEEYDAYYINGIYSKYFSILPLRILKKQKQRAKVIVAVRGMLAKGAMQFGTLKKKSFIQVAKLSGLYKGVVFQATNVEEEADIRTHINKDAKIEVIPNLPRFASPNNKPIEKKSGELKVLCLARIAVEKNNLFAIERVAQLRGKILLDLCGVIYDQEYWAKCKKAIDELPPNITVRHIHGIDGSNVPQFISDHHVLFLPSLGENFGHVIFESLSEGRPVVISDRTPWRDLEDARAGYVLPLEGKVAFEEAIKELAQMDQVAFNEWSDGAFNYALRYLEADKTAAKYLELFSP